MILLRLIALFWKPIAWVLGALGIYGKGRADARAKAKLHAQKTYMDKRKRMDNADADLHDDPGILRDILRARDPKQR